MINEAGNNVNPFFYFFLKKFFMEEKKSFLASAKLLVAWVVKKIFTILRIKIIGFPIFFL